MIRLLQLLRDLVHALLHLHNPEWYHPDDSYTRWLLRERAYYLVACRRCDASARRRGFFGGER